MNFRKSIVLQLLLQLCLIATVYGATSVVRKATKSTGENQVTTVVDSRDVKLGQKATVVLHEARVTVINECPLSEEIESLNVSNRAVLTSAFHDMVKTYVDEADALSYGDALALAVPFGVGCSDKQLVSYITSLGFKEVLICSIDGEIVASISTEKVETEADRPLEFLKLSLVNGRKTYGFLLCSELNILTIQNDVLPETSIAGAFFAKFTSSRELIGLRGMILLGVFGIIIASLILVGVFKTINYGISR